MLEPRLPVFQIIDLVVGLRAAVRVNTVPIEAIYSESQYDRVVRAMQRPPSPKQVDVRKRREGGEKGVT